MQVIQCVFISAHLRPAMDRLERGDWMEQVLPGACWKKFQEFYNILSNKCLQMERKCDILTQDIVTGYCNIDTIHTRAPKGQVPGVLCKRQGAFLDGKAVH